VTGATGSGKSTTLSALIQSINIQRSVHIITIEDPVEVLFSEQKATINQREVGVDTPSFGSALRAALRQNPDIILVGELRDRETVETTLMAAETGHLVLSTLHTHDSVDSLNRIMSYFPPHQHAMIRSQLGTTLKVVVSQRLVPRADGRSLVPAMEIMVVNQLIREAILQGSPFEVIYDAIRKGGDTYGMQSFDRALYDLFSKGSITLEQALKYSSSPSNMKRALDGVTDHL
jgi:twitching motility protein PilT